MRKLLLAVFCLLISATGLMAKPIGTTQVEITGSYLMSTTMKETSNTYYATLSTEAEADMGSGYNFDFSFKYFFAPEVAFKVGAGYSSNEIVAKDGSTEDKYTFKFFQIHAGLDYYLTEIAFIGFGLNYGILADDVKEDFNGVDATIKDGENGYSLNNNLAFYFEMGVDYPINEQVGFLFAITVDCGLNKVLENDQLSSYEYEEVTLLSVGFKFGLSFAF